MTLFAGTMLVLFVMGWCVAVGAWFYGTRFFLPRWTVGFRKVEKHEGYGDKAVKGYAIFLAAIAFCFVVAGLAQLAGGWD